MQQHSQIIELKDRLAQALDVQYNVKDIDEVTRVISILEQTSVTREDLEKTRLGRVVNELRKKTTDKELAKRAKNLIKSWRELTCQTNSTPLNAAALTSPFGTNSNSLGPYSPHGPLQGGYTSTSNGYSREPPAEPGSNRSGSGGGALNHHPALTRLRNQHASLTSPNEKSSKAIANSLSPSLSGFNVSPSAKNGGSKVNSVSYRPQNSNASPQNNELVNGFRSSPSHPHKRTSHSPVNVSSPKLSNGFNFKNIFVKDGISPNSYRRHATSPSPNSINLLASSIPSSDSTSLSRHCSPSFTFSNDSRDSFSNKNSYSNNGDFSTLDTNDEDSNSSVFSSISTDGALANGKSVESNSNNNNNKKRDRKRRTDTENNLFRENLHSAMSSGRRLQSTEELLQKFNIKLNSATSRLHANHNSLSASSSPRFLFAKDAREVKNKRSEGNYYDDNSLNGFESYPNKSLPSSPFKQTDYSTITYPAGQSRDFFNEDEDEPDVTNNSCLSLGHAIESETEFKCHDKTFKNSISDIDREIMELYAKLPKINEEDIKLKYNFKFDDPEEVYNDEEVASDSKTSQESEDVNGDDYDEYETFEYNLEYEEEEDEEVEVTDSEVGEDDFSNDLVDQGSPIDEEVSFQLTTKCDISQCDTTDIVESGPKQDRSSTVSDNNGAEAAAERQLRVDNVDDTSCSDAITSRTSGLPGLLHSSPVTEGTADASLASINQHDSSAHSFDPLPLSSTKYQQDLPTESMKIDDPPLPPVTEQLTKSSKRTKVITRRLTKKKYRKCIGKSKVKKALVDRLANEQWEFVNGNYDKDGVWRDFGEMTSAYVLSSGDNTSDENVLHILPYVNYTW